MILSLVGNKSDLEEHRAVTALEAAQYAASIGASYCETSALHDQVTDIDSNHVFDTDFDSNRGFDVDISFIYF